MSDEPIRSAKRVLEPNERIAEVLFGLIMVLTCTGSLSVAQAHRTEVRTMLIAALGCNVAWGIIDGLLYLMGCLNEQARGIRLWRALRKATTPPQANRIIANALPPMLAAAFGSAEYESIGQKLAQIPEPPSRPRLAKDQWFGALWVCLWVIFTTVPVAIPFIFMEDIARAMRVSNGIAVALLFVTGCAFGRLVEYRPWLTGIAMVVLGMSLVALTMALGG